MSWWMTDVLEWLFPWRAEVRHRLRRIEAELNSLREQHHCDPLDPTGWHMPFRPWVIQRLEGIEAKVCDACHSLRNYRETLRMSEDKVRTALDNEIKSPHT